MSGKLRRKVAINSSFYAFFVAVFFILLGKWLFAYFGISLSHFKIAGGLVLLVLSIRELVIYGEDKGKIGGLGVVPIGIPLIVGPATLSAGIKVSHNDFKFEPEHIYNRGYALILGELGKVFRER